MKKRIHIYSFLSAAVLVMSSSVLTAQDAHEKLKVPGYRPESKLAESFLQKLDASKIAIFPTLVRTQEGTFHSEASQKAVVAYLRENKMGSPELQKKKLDVGELKGKFQYAIFNNDLKKIGEAVKTQSGADYFLVLEFLVTPTPSGDIAIGGIHVYLLDAKGENAFSFLLNSHHSLFVDAKLKSADSSENGRDALVMKGTKVALSAFLQQIEAVK